MRHASPWLWNPFYFLSDPSHWVSFKFRILSAKAPDNVEQRQDNTLQIFNSLSESVKIVKRLLCWGLFCHYVCGVFHSLMKISVLLSFTVMRYSVVCVYWLGSDLETWLCFTEKKDFWLWGNFFCACAQPGDLPWALVTHCLSLKSSSIPMFTQCNLCFLRDLNICANSVEIE